MAGLLHLELFGEDVAVGPDKKACVHKSIADCFVGKFSVACFLLVESECFCAVVSARVSWIVCGAFGEFCFDLRVHHCPEEYGACKVQVGVTDGNVHNTVGHEDYLPFTIF